MQVDEPSSRFLTRFRLNLVILAWRALCLEFFRRHFLSDVASSDYIATRLATPTKTTTTTKWENDEQATFRVNLLFAPISTPTRKMFVTMFVHWFHHKMMHHLAMASAAIHSKFATCFSWSISDHWTLIVCSIWLEYDTCEFTQTNTLTLNWSQNKSKFTKQALYILSS